MMEVAAVSSATTEPQFTHVTK